RIKPYSVRASTAYWLHVGTKRHVAGRSGDTMCRYSWIKKISARAAALPAVWIIARTRADALTAPFPPTQTHVATRVAAPAPTVPTTRSDYLAAPGLPPARIDADRPTWFERHAAADGRPGDVPRPNPQACR